MTKTEKRSNCGISSALDILGDKWSLLIIRDIVFKGKSRFGEFIESEEGIATNILSNRLARLETEGILCKETALKKNSTSYILTDKGKDLIPVLVELLLWSDKYNDISENGKKLALKIKKDKDSFIKIKMSQNITAEEK